MRVTAVIALSLAAVFGSSVAAAQGAALRPVEPSTGLELSLDAVHESAGEVTGGQVGLAVAGHVAPVHFLELGVGWGLRTSWARLDGGAGRARLGLPPLRTWVGAGGRALGLALGIRLEGGVGPQALSAAPWGSNGGQGFVQVHAEMERHQGLVALRLGLRGGYAYSSAHSAVGAARLTVELGDPRWVVQPFVAVDAMFASDLGWAGRPSAGAWFELGPAQLRIALVGPVAGTGQNAALAIGLHLGGF